MAANAVGRNFVPKAFAGMKLGNRNDAKQRC
jgi:hypothetical protein